MFASSNKCAILKANRCLKGVFMRDFNQLTPKQEQILEYLKEVILAKGYPPTVREIGEKVSLKSTSSVFSHLEALERKGYIKRDPSKPRAIDLDFRNGMAVELAVELHTGITHLADTL